MIRSCFKIPQLARYGVINQLEMLIYSRVNILRAIEADPWVDVGRIASTAPSKHRPAASYRVHEERVTLYDKEYRAVVVHSSAHDKRRQMTGCFVQLTNVPSEGEQGYRAEEILRTYEDQHAIERNFGFLKDDQIVNALFLKRPQPH
jgi:hypothetical protein